MIKFVLQTHTHTHTRTHTQGEKFDKERGPGIDKLVEQEDVDQLSYMGWQLDQAADPEKVGMNHIPML